ncbi:MAG TPA: hypothetical protein VI113_05130 [Alphaproteobacteria bacterium]
MAELQSEQDSPREAFEGADFPGESASEGERRRRVRGRRGGRRRRRGERPGEERPSAGSATNEGSHEGPGPDSDAFVLPPSSTEGSAVEANAEFAAAEPDRARRRRPRRQRRAEAEADTVAVEGAKTATAEPESLLVAPLAEPQHLSFTRPPEPEPLSFAPSAKSDVRMPIEKAARPAPAEDAPKNEPAEPQAPAIPVITVGAGSDEQPKKRGWWRRLTE